MTNFLINFFFFKNQYLMNKNITTESVLFTKKVFNTNSKKISSK